MRQALALGAAPFALSAGPAFGGTVAADFNGDGWSDLAIGVPHEDIGTTWSDAGVVQLIYGGPQGLDPSDIVTQGSDEETGDQFGYSLAAGDFNGDGYADLAVGVPYEDVTINSIPSPITYTDMSEVDVFWGSAAGLDRGAKPVTELFQDSFTYDTADHFGWSLAGANFGKEGAADLAVGAPDDNTVGVNNGSVSIFYGHTTGIDLAPASIFAQSDSDVRGDPNDGERFGSALAAANFGKSSQADLAVGVSSDWVETTEQAGSVNVLYGSADGIVTTGNQRWTQNSPGIAGTAERPDGFGVALAAADLGKSSYADLAVASPCENVGGVDCAGGVNVIYGRANGLSARGDQFWSQSSSGVADKPEQGDGFGLSLTAANLGKSKQADLAIASDETIRGHSGAVEVLYGASNGLRATGSQFWSQASTDISGSPGTLDGFGRALGAGNFGYEGHADLAIGIPGEHYGSVNGAGAVEVIYSRSKGLVTTFDDLLNQFRVDSGDDPEQQDNFGWSLSPRPSNLGIFALP